MATTIMSLSLPKETAQFIRKTARVQRTTQSSVVREAIQRYELDQEWDKIQDYGRKVALRLGIASYDDVDRIAGKR